MTDTFIDKRLADRAAVIIGAGQTPGANIGNGRAVAELFARHGARLFLVDRDQASLAETAERVAQYDVEIHTHVADVADVDSCRAIAGAAQAALGGIDILHNNVGILAGDGSALDLEADNWNRIMDINLRSTWLISQGVAAIMRDSGRGGAITSISSIGGISAEYGVFAYSISKAGVNHLTRSLAREVGEYGIRVNAIMPGFINTPLGNEGRIGSDAAMLEDWDARRSGRVPLGRQGTAWDVAAAALYLASDDAAYVTGVVLPVDGGMSLTKYAR